MYVVGADQADFARHTEATALVGVLYRSTCVWQVSVSESTISCHSFNNSRLMVAKKATKIGMPHSRQLQECFISE